MLKNFFVIRQRLIRPGYSYPNHQGHYGTTQGMHEKSYTYVEAEPQAAQHTSGGPATSDL